MFNGFLAVLEWEALPERRRTLHEPDCTFASVTFMYKVLPLPGAYLGISWNISFESRTPLLWEKISFEKQCLIYILNAKHNKARTKTLFHTLATILISLSKNNIFITVFKGKYQFTCSVCGKKSSLYIVNDKDLIFKQKKIIYIAPSLKIWLKILQICCFPSHLTIKNHIYTSDLPLSLIPHEKTFILCSGQWNILHMNFYALTFLWKFRRLIKFLNRVYIRFCSFKVSGDIILDTH